MIKGSVVAIVTPMHSDGSLDIPRLRQLIDWHIAEGTDGIVIVGTSGESPTVSVQEHSDLIKIAVDHVAKRVPVIAGTGGNSTAESIELTRYAKEVGADAALVVVPYYNRPTQEGLYQHFKAIAEAVVDMPIILYNVPSRTVADMSNETILRLAKIPNIVGVKDATGKLDRGIELLRQKPADFAVYSGDDSTALPLILCGAQGTISVTANIMPRMMHDMVVAAASGELQKAITLNNTMMPLNVHLFVEPNPVPVKWAMQELGKIEAGIRLPLVPLNESFHAVVRNALRESGVLK